MTTEKFSTLVLAAGKGTRMKSALPKVLHRACGQTLLTHVLLAASKAGADSHYVVVGHGRDEVLAELGQSGLPFAEVWQKEQKGTGHAAQMALPVISEKHETILILNGDGPLLRPETLEALLESHKSRKADLTLGVMELEDPTGYGRVSTGAGGTLKKIVEQKEASAKEQKIKLVNGGVYAVSRKYLSAFLPLLKPSAKAQELYLTDIVALGAAKKKKLFTFPMPAEELKGVNDFAQLAEVEEILHQRQRLAWMKDGVRLEAPSTLFADTSVSVGSGTRIGPNVVLKGKTSIGLGATIEAGCVIVDSEIEGGAEIKAYSHLELATVKAGAHVGPFARLRPGTEIGVEAKIGNFVEVKNSKFGPGSKANHLSYVGDTTVGKDVNIGCGFVSCNYDGFNKHETVIEDGAFVGSGVRAVAPVTIGKNSYVATGSTITQNVPEDALAIARPKQENKLGYSPRLKARMIAQKKAKGK
ncbi:MAG: bifunctional UDP-N-acetylglucosamine diphosphorylase/glucosamine-1-phosphate N-acetyltransferase GlmU [Bdellovibrionota bacterium]